MEAVICGFMYMIVLTAGGMSSRADRIVMPRAKSPEEIQCRRPGSYRPAHIPQPSSICPETVSAPRKESSCGPCRTGALRTWLHALFPLSGHQQWVKSDPSKARKVHLTLLLGLCSLGICFLPFSLCKLARAEKCPLIYSPWQSPSWKHF